MIMWFRNTRAWFWLAGAVGVAWCGEFDPTLVLARVRSKVVGDATKIPRYVCRENIERRVYALQAKAHPDCTRLIAEQAAPVDAHRRLTSMDGAKLDVMLEEGTELFSWPGGSKFDSSDPGDLLVSGMSGSGDFASFLLSIFAGEGTTFQYRGPCTGPSCMQFTYRVSRLTSHYVLKTNLGSFAVAYDGTFDVDPRGSELLRLTVLPHDVAKLLTGVCDMRTQITYVRAKTETGEFIIPAATQKSLILADGSYFENVVAYEGCRQYTSESAVKFGDDVPANFNDQSKTAPALPAPGTELDIRLVSPIDSDTSTAGDPISGTLVHGVRDTTGGTIAAGAILRGHLAGLQRRYLAHNSITITIRFDTIVLSGNQFDLLLEPLGRKDLRGRAVFSFPSQKVVLGPKFVSRWRVGSH